MKNQILNYFQTWLLLKSGFADFETKLWIVKLFFICWRGQQNDLFFFFFFFGLTKTFEITFSFAAIILQNL